MRLWGNSSRVAARRRVSRTGDPRAGRRRSTSPAAATRLDPTLSGTTPEKRVVPLNDAHARGELFG